MSAATPVIVDDLKKDDPVIVLSKEEVIGLKEEVSVGATSSSSSVESDSDEDVFPTGLHQRKNKAATSTTTSATQKEEEEDKKKDKPIQPKNELTVARYLEIAAGSLIFFPALPYLFVQIVGCNLWEFLDQRVFHAVDFLERINQWTAPYQEWLVANPKDSFVVNYTLWLGGVLPAYFIWEAVAQANAPEFIWWRAVLYNAVRIGPMYRHFMYVYTLSHKEAHCYGKIFAAPYHHVLQYTYNYYIGFFHGVLPGPFTQSHIYNHHKYDNNKDDVYSTGSFRRDSFLMFLRYVGVWFQYAFNLSTAVQFAKEGKTQRVMYSILGTLQYMAQVALMAYLVNPMTAFAYILWPFIEGNILLAAVNYTWHAFIDPNDFDNDYVNSVTILDALNFALAEEYHVVHHQYAGVHWSRHAELYEKHHDEYVKSKATVFQGSNLFVVWGMILARDYQGLADMFVQLEPDKSKHLSQEEVAQLMKERLQCTSWSYN
ncbi:Fatty acid desaturase [Seminavis robusta]|uniref:Fatty acid desaturase n=1 Tax=Seminavis robusta TaxID=568900 RepID=A0A9N8DZ41_9STRA|nr:Fatty acid desaturase [Seminavis robusta]|eukprot:Sro465_g148700.1 Fatty acid desaturase (486) ;mRNA; r:62213-63856